VNLALPSLLLLFFVLPGIIARRSYLTSPLSDTNIATEVAWAVIPAALLHLAAIRGIAWLTSFKVDFATLGLLLAGSREDAATRAAFEALGRALAPIALYSVVLLPSAGALVGFLGRRIVIASGMDLRFPVLRPYDDWNYLISGRLSEGAADFDLIWVDAMVTAGSGTILYSGILQSLLYSSDASIEAVVFASAQKWMKPGALDPVPIPGAAFAVKFTEILNLNVSHYRLE
jgi:hypothetical protein